MRIISGELKGKKLSVPLDTIGVEIKSANKFWLAEDYHQDFAVKNPLKYNFYRTSCGRDIRLKRVWGNINNKK